MITESLDYNLSTLDHFIIMNSHKLGIIGLNLQIAPHLSIQLMLIHQFISSLLKNTPANLRQGIVYDSPAPAQNRYGSQQANQFNPVSIPQNRNMRGMNYPFNQQKN